MASVFSHVRQRVLQERILSLSKPHSLAIIQPLALLPATARNHISIVVFKVCVRAETALWKVRFLWFTCVTWLHRRTSFLVWVTNVILLEM